jgi:FolB domain-containing protein
MMKIVLSGLRVEAKVGVLRWEELGAQTIAIDLELTLRQPPHADHLAETVDYDEIVSTVKAFLKERRFRLLESLTSSLANMLMQRFAFSHCLIQATKLEVSPGGAKVTVVVEKP